ncbi:hypothetical protein DVH24_010278 [Malus domestica]|uniref:Uncharacterized protein n=1 Tax=Malus domestica TaxID=3750 RepID=A0A498JVH7_MALDO|nr:hypothetical protein DVH24_010278 [Malus domestica]
MAAKLEDMNMDDASEEVAVEIAAQGVLRKRVDEMEAGFMMALDYMMQLADSDQDDKIENCLQDLFGQRGSSEYYGRWILDKRNDRGFNTLPESEVCICIYKKTTGYPFWFMKYINYSLLYFGKIVFLDKIPVSAGELLNQTGGLNLG